MGLRFTKVRSEYYLAIVRDATGAPLSTGGFRLLSEESAQSH